MAVEAGCPFMSLSGLAFCGKCSWGWRRRRPAATAQDRPHHLHRRTGDHRQGPRGPLRLGEGTGEKHPNQTRTSLRATASSCKGVNSGSAPPPTAGEGTTGLLSTSAVSFTVIPVDLLLVNKPSPGNILEIQLPQTLPVDRPPPRGPHPARRGWILAQIAATKPALLPRRAGNPWRRTIMTSRWPSTVRAGAYRATTEESIRETQTKKSSSSKQYPFSKIGCPGRSGSVPGQSGWWWPCLPVSPRWQRWSHLPPPRSSLLFWPMPLSLSLRW